MIEIVIWLLAQIEDLLAHYVSEQTDRIVAVEQ
jgi:hypothetical protein